MRNYLRYFLFILFVSSSLFAEAEISPDLQQKIDEALPTNSPVRAVILLADRVDIQALDQQLYAEQATPQERAFRVITALKQKAEATQGPLASYLSSRAADEVLEFESLWITNMFRVVAVPSVLLEISQRSDVDFMDYEHIPRPDETIDEGPAPENLTNNVEPGLRLVNAHRMWEMGYTGDGSLVMNIDTGVDGNHPALSDRWRGNHVPASQAWLGTGSFPIDCGSTGHGTHTMGTITGREESTGDTVGVAPDAEWIAAGGLNCGTSTFAAFQWAMDPDGNPNTVDDMPDVVSNSWGIGSGGGCRTSWEPTLNAVEAAGIAVVFSAGNSGPNPQTITGPKNLNTNLVNTWATGNIQGGTPDLSLRSSSSRGPSGCGGSGSLAIKPEAVAPGTSVRSSIPGGGYGFKTGTSMACPHVAGAVALLKQAFPQKTGHEIKLALYYTARETPADLAGNDPGEPAGLNSGEDNNFGMGLIDVYAAYGYLIGAPNSPQNFVAYSDYTTPTSIQLTWTDPTNLVNGDTLMSGDFHVIIERDGTVIDSVTGGAGQYTDSGLNDGQEYYYQIFARVDSNGAGGPAISASWIAGGSPIPNPPLDVAISGNQNQIMLTWTNPSKNIDSTPMDDFAAINLYQDSSLAASFTRTSADTAQADSLTYAPAVPGYYDWHITAIDNEIPQNESVGSAVLRSPLNVNIVDHFAEIGNPDSMLWQNADAVIDDRAVSPPSGPLSLNLNGTPNGGDVVELYPVDLSEHQSSGIVFAYHYQPQGIGDAPEADDSLKLEFKNDLGIWILIRSYGGSNVVPFQFEEIDLALAPNGGGSYFHSQFQVRLTADVSPHPVIPRDDWFVDNIYLGTPAPAIAVSHDTVMFDTTQVGATDTVRFEVQNIGLQQFAVLDIINPSSVFSLDTSNFTVGPSTHQSVNLSFTPPSQNAFSTTIRIVHNAPNQDTLNVYVEGVGGDVTGIAEATQLPKTYDLGQNYPNPFNPTTTIQYQLPRPGNVKLVIYNLLGQAVRSLANGPVEAGYHQVQWDGRNESGVKVSSGIYIYRFEATSISEAGNGFRKVRKMIMLK